MDPSNASFFTEDYESNKYRKKYILDQLNALVIQSEERIDENSFYFSRTFVERADLYIKQVNLYFFGKYASEKICEIGFNAGHSALLFLLGRIREPVTYTVFDIGQHTYTVPCLNYMKTAFPFARFEYIEGDSTVTLPNWVSTNKADLATYGLVHVDGGQSKECIISDMKYADILVKSNGVIIVNNTNINYINDIVDTYIDSEDYAELTILPVKGCTHRVLHKIKGL
jgi:hypothetical protein